MRLMGFFLLANIKKHRNKYDKYSRDNEDMCVSTNNKSKGPLTLSDVQTCADDDVCDTLADLLVDYLLVNLENYER